MNSISSNFSKFWLTLSKIGLIGLKYLENCVFREFCNFPYLSTFQLLIQRKEEKRMSRVFQNIVQNDAFGD